MSVSSLHRMPARATEVEVQHTDAGHVLSRPGQRVAHVLNDTAFALWELCDGQTEVEEIVVAVAELFGLDVTTARREITGTLDELAEVGLIGWGDGTLGGDRG